MYETIVELVEIYSEHNMETNKDMIHSVKLNFRLIMKNSEKVSSEEPINDPSKQNS